MYNAHIYPNTTMHLPNKLFHPFLFSLSYVIYTAQNLVYKNTINMANLLKLLSNMIDAYEKFISFNNRVRKVVIDRVKNKHWRMYEIANDGVDFS